jgi:excisionase family DNA binding protein
MSRIAIAPPRVPHPTPATPIDRMLLTVEEAAAALGVGRSFMFELIAAGQIETVRVGRLRRIRPEALRHYVDSLSG